MYIFKKTLVRINQYNCKVSLILIGCSLQVTLCQNQKWTLWGLRFKTPNPRGGQKLHLQDPKLSPQFLKILGLLCVKSPSHVETQLSGFLKCTQLNGSKYCYVSLRFGLIGFYGTSIIVGYLMPNPLYSYILNIYDLVWFYGISTIVGYLMPNPVYTYILNMYDS